MSGFSADWLRLREPYDTDARSDDFVAALQSRLPLRPLRAMDLGTGTAANIRYLAPRLTGEQLWLAVDNDAKLLAEQPADVRGAEFTCTLKPLQVDLAGELSKLPFKECQLVTASALLDLVSASWLQQLASHCARANATVLFALNYDGHIECSPRDPDDDWLVGLVNRHQQGDKGFGPALGPQAWSHALKLFDSLGYSVRAVASDWLIDAAGRDMQCGLIDGWVAAACEMAGEDKKRVMEWGERRTSQALAGKSRIRVGHQDVMAWRA